MGETAASKLVAVTISQEQARLLPESLVARPAVAPASVVDSGSMQLCIGTIELVLQGTVDREQLLLVLETLLRSR